MKRKILAIMLSSMLAFSFTACGNTEETADGTVTNAEADVDVADTGTDVENDARFHICINKQAQRLFVAQDIICTSSDDHTV